VSQPISIGLILLLASVVAAALCGVRAFRGCQSRVGGLLAGLATVAIGLPLALLAGDVAASQPWRALFHAPSLALWMYLACFGLLGVREFAEAWTREPDRR